jgi:hypothetical protein
MKTDQEQCPWSNIVLVQEAQHEEFEGNNSIDVEVLVHKMFNSHNYKTTNRQLPYEGRRNTWKSPWAGIFKSTCNGNFLNGNYNVNKGGNLARITTSQLFTMFIKLNWFDLEVKQYLQFQHSKQLTKLKQCFVLLHNPNPLL